MNKKQTIFDDLKEIKGYILGIVAFATTVGAFLVEVLHFAPEPTVITVGVVAVCMLFIGYLINRSEHRQQKNLEAYKKESEHRGRDLTRSLDEIKNLAIETRLDNLRTLLTMYITDQPENHDTILKIAQKYFVEFGGDWVMTDEFLRWADEETEKGRKVHIPGSLLDTVKMCEKEEKDGVL